MGYHFILAQRIRTASASRAATCHRRQLVQAKIGNFAKMAGGGEQFVDTEVYKPEDRVAFTLDAASQGCTG